jgi:hypothetical protein
MRKLGEFIPVKVTESIYNLIKQLRLHEYLLIELNFAILPFNVV